MGLVTQLASFSSEVSQAATPLRELLKTKNQFIWMSPHEQAFEAVKKALVKTPILAPFDPKRETKLEVDASRLHGLGFNLLQKHDEHWKLIQCGSRFLSDPESRYAMIELECIAIMYGIKKCHMYLAGLEHFTVVTDHRPLVPIMNNYSLSQIENAKIQKIKADLTSSYQFTVEWKRGKDHSIADCLSRAPVDPPSEDEEFANIGRMTIAAIRMTIPENDDERPNRVNSVKTYANGDRKIRSTSDDDEPETTTKMPDLIMDEKREAAHADPDYCALVEAIKNDFENIEKAPKFVRQFKSMRHELSIEDGLILYGPRLVVPTSKRREVLRRLHIAHQGMTRTKARARSALYWPGIGHEITQMIENCDACQERLPSHPKETLMTDPIPTRPFQEVSADLFSLAGKTFLVYVDRKSGYPLIAEWRNDPTSNQVAYECREFFALLGVPNKMRTDGGPQFASSSFAKFLKRWGVEWAPSTPHFPSSNGLAECYVKQLKSLLAKLEHPDIKSEEFQEAILELRNTPRMNGLSPNQVLFGHNLRSTLPAHHSAFDPKWQSIAEQADKEMTLREKAKEFYNHSARDLKPLRVGMKVRIQDHVSKRWSHVGEIVGVGEKRDYRIKMPSGRTWWRNRRFLRKFNEELERESDGESEEDDDAHPTTIENESTNEPPKPKDVRPRRSSRESKPTVRFGINSIKYYEVTRAEKKFKSSKY